jgi:hypothetical protein
MRAVETKATTHEVIMTTGKAKLVITFLHFQNSFHDVVHAASYTSGGRKMGTPVPGLSLPEKTQQSN